MLALNRAKEINCTVDEFWMGLAHDIGKLDTGNSESHIGHEKNIGLVDEFCRGMKLTAEQVFLCVTFARNHMRLLRFNEMRPYKIAQMLDEFRATHTLAITISMAVCAGADALGRAKETFVPFTLYDVEMALEAFRKVTGNDIVQACVAAGKPMPKGKKFGQRLNEMRGMAIKKALGRQ
mgnify:CR=1 FL=1